MLDLRSFQAIIFDMDGVLFDSSQGHTEAFQQVLSPRGIQDFRYESVAGMRTDEAFRHIYAERDLVLHEEDLVELIAAKRHHAAQVLSVHGKLFPGAEELLALLKPRYRLALASSASPAAVTLFLDKIPDHPFEFALNGDSVNNAKPNPAIYTLACEQLGLLPRQCLVIEDAENGVRSAQAAGIPVIAIVDKARARVFRERGATATVTDIHELHGLFMSEEGSLHEDRPNLSS